MLQSHGLEVNPTKCKIFLINPKSKECKETLTSFRSITDEVIQVEKEDLKILGSPIFPKAMLSVLESKFENLELMSSRLRNIDSHSALYLLRNCFSMPKLTYLLRSSPCFIKSDLLKQCNSIIKKTLTQILCTQLREESWDQATLPVFNGGLGLRPACEVAISGYLSSVKASTAITLSLLPAGWNCNENKCFEMALLEWKSRSGQVELPQYMSFQSECDKPMYLKRHSNLPQSTTLNIEKVRLLSVSSESASSWLQAIPIPSLGLHLEPLSLKVACGLHLGSQLCHHHQCICSVTVEWNWRHGLACKKQNEHQKEA